MPQQFHVLRCFHCSTFQVHQVNKSLKWCCKICEEKQSIKRNYGTGSGKECRLHVQKLNTLRCQAEENIAQQQSHSQNVEENTVHENTASCNYTREVTNVSKWHRYIESEQDNESKASHEKSINESEVVLECPKQKKRNKTELIEHVMQNIEVPLNANCNINQNMFYNNCIPDTVINVPIKKVNIHSPKDSEMNPSNHLPTENYNLSDKSNFKIIKSKEHKSIISKNSKWAQFINSEDESDIENNISQESVHTEAKDSVVGLHKDYIDSTLKDSINSHISSKSTQVSNFNSIDKNSRCNEKLQGLVGNSVKCNNALLFSQSNDEDIDELLNF